MYQSEGCQLDFFESFDNFIPHHHYRDLSHLVFGFTYSNQKFSSLSLFLHLVAYFLAEILGLI